MTTEERLKRIEELEEKATPGPWHLLDECRVWSAVKSEPLVTETYAGYESAADWQKEQDNAEAAGKRGAANAELIAHLRNEARWLVARVRKLEKVREAATTMFVGNHVAEETEYLSQCTALRKALADCDDEAAKP